MYITTIYNHRVKRQLICRSSDCVQCWCLRRLPCPYKNKAKVYAYRLIELFSLPERNVENKSCCIRRSWKNPGFPVCLRSTNQKGSIFMNSFRKQLERGWSAMSSPPSQSFVLMPPTEETAWGKDKVVHLLFFRHLFTLFMCVCLFFCGKLEKLAETKKKKKEKSSRLDSPTQGAMLYILYWTVLNFWLLRL